MKVTASITKKKNSKGLEKLMEHFRKITNTEVDVGYFEDSGTHSESNIPYAALMRIHEDGLGDFPARPAIREGAKKIERNLDKGTLAIVMNNTITQVGRLPENSKILGEAVAGQMRSIFGDVGLLAPNAPTTIYRKGKDEPLVDTGELRDNLGSKTTYDKSVNKGD